MKVQAPRGCRIVSIGGTEVALDETGAIEVPDRIGHDLIAYHGFKAARGEGARSVNKSDKKDGGRIRP